MRLPWVLQDPLLRSLLFITTSAGLGIGLVIPFLTLTARDRGVSLSVIGIMASSYLVSQMLLQLPMGMLSDRIGRVVPISLGMLVIALATMGFAFADSGLAFVVLRVLQGFGVALLYPSFRALIADATPVNRRGQAYAAVAAAFSGGMLFGPTIGGLVVRLFDVNVLFFLAGVVEIAVSLAGFLLLRNAGKAGSTLQGDERVPYRELLNRPLFAALMLGFGGQFQMGLFIGIWAIYLDERGATDIQLGMAFSAVSVTFMAFAPLGGRLADRGEYWRLLLLSNLALGSIVAVYGFLPSPVLIIALALVEGLVLAIAHPALDAYLASVADPRVQGRVQGTFATIGMAGAAVSGFLSAALYAVTMYVPFVLSGVVLIVLTILATRIIRDIEGTRDRLRVSTPATGYTAIEQAGRAPDGIAPAPGSVSHTRVTDEQSAT
jgi:MFS transporter, DHA1 family, multidrug resistance protein